MTAKRKDIKEKQLQGFKYFQAIAKMLDGLHDAGCARDRAGNRQLHMDQYMALIILYLFNPICTSLRALQQASELKKVQKKLGCPRASLGSLSEAARVFDSKLMAEIVENLSEKLDPIPGDPKLDNLVGTIVAVDGTLINALSKMAWALWKSDHNAVKAHTQFDLSKHIPIKITITAANASETGILEQNLEAERIYVEDRGYASLAHFQKILNAQSSFVCRLRDKAVYDCLKEHPLTQEAKDAGILSDKTVRLGSTAKTREQLSVPVRLIEVKCTPHRKRQKTGRGGPEQGESLLIATDRFDLDADVIAVIFKHRWAVETFFNFFKHILGCRHLLSTCQNGIQLQMYAAIIACMLIALWTGRKPTKRTYEMLCWYFCGIADQEELLAHIARLQTQN